ncbi:chitobiase/beta-hexosaminidase C-terminal domain-containing protein [Terrimonas pollutisoli]|uniref:chitobiase/beta-hexosaminidase C-terminal domain-containing protein n=1 Tax=Terrimonas pollutisoli TaxID=3034147 RepID=UPI0023EC6FAF|nr:chitobiase/beta-hexosaminidase C-terminal domain-containing protein [Terrimonas sp. H1YJ31]
MQIIVLALVLVLLNFQKSFGQQKFQLAPPMLKYESGFFSGKTSFEVIFNQPGAEVRYTLNGNEPTQKDFLYSKAVSITKKTLVKVKAFGNDFLPSETVTASFITEGKKIKQAIYSKPNESYANSKANILIDNIGGQVNYRSGSWVGFDNDTVTIDIELQKKEKVSKVLISVLQNEKSWIFLPEQILAYYYNEQQKAFLSLGKETFQFDEPGPKQVNIREINLSTAIKTKQLKLVFFPLKKIPAWHGGKGNHGWLFLDEIKVY